MACMPSRSILGPRTRPRLCLSIHTVSSSTRTGEGFFDEGGGLVHETWSGFARRIHFETPGGRAYAILDSRLFDIAGFERAIRSEVPPHEADTLDELARLIGVDAFASRPDGWKLQRGGDWRSCSVLRRDAM